MFKNAKIISSEFISYFDIHAGKLIDIFHSNKNDTIGVTKIMIATTIKADCLLTDLLKLKSKPIIYPKMSIGVINVPIALKN
tara:strand:+ start:112 stop:357 length:246 start_codon:yes stop_codon:yes gene_type:complete